MSNPRALIFRVIVNDPFVERTGGDADMAAAVLYLAGPGGVFLNGQVLYPDGGMLLHIVPPRYQILIAVVGNVLTSPSST